MMTPRPTNCCQTSRTMNFPTTRNVTLTNHRKSRPRTSRLTLSPRQSHSGFRCRFFPVRNSRKSPVPPPQSKRLIYFSLFFPQKVYISSYNYINFTTFLLFCQYIILVYAKKMRGKPVSGNPRVFYSSICLPKYIAAA